MATRAILATTDWVQVTDGTQAVIVQIMGFADVCDNPTKPTENQAAHNFNHTTLQVNPPTVLWVRSAHAGGTVRVVVS